MARARDGHLLIAPDVVPAVELLPVDPLETFVRGQADTPKSEKSERTIALGERLASELFDHRARTAFVGEEERGGGRDRADEADGARRSQRLRHDAELHRPSWRGLPPGGRPAQGAAVRDRNARGEAMKATIIVALAVALGVTRSACSATRDEGIVKSRAGRRAERPGAPLARR
jgi:hypothetical protein